MVFGGSWNSRRQGLVLRVHEGSEGMGGKQRDQGFGYSSPTASDPMGCGMVLRMELTVGGPLADPGLYVTGA